MGKPTVAVPLLPPWLRWLCVVAVGVAIFVLSIVAAPPETAVVPDFGLSDVVPLDKWRHFLAYAVLGGALAYATVDWERSTRTLAVAILAVVVAYGVAIEVWQWFLPDRYFGLGDAYANALGGVLAVPLVFLRGRVPFVSVGELLASFRE